MKTLKKTMIALILPLCVSLSAKEPNVNWKRIHKTLEKEWPGIIHKTNTIVAVAGLEDLPSPFLEKGIFTLQKNGSFIGYLCLAHSKGRMDMFDYMVLYNPDLSVRKVEILTYQSNYGSQVRSKSWLKQFIGYKEGDLAYGKEIQALSGATLSAKSLTKDIEILTETLHHYRENGLLK